MRWFIVRTKEQRTRLFAPITIRDNYHANMKPLPALPTKNKQSKIKTKLRAITEIIFQ
jgi:hypothetical protein